MSQGPQQDRPRRFRPRASYFPRPTGVCRPKIPTPEIRAAMFAPRPARRRIVTMALALIRSRLPGLRRSRDRDADRKDAA